MIKELKKLVNLLSNNNELYVEEITSQIKTNKIGMYLTGKMDRDETHQKWKGHFGAVKYANRFLTEDDPDTIFNSIEKIKQFSDNQVKLYVIWTQNSRYLIFTSSNVDIIISIIKSHSENLEYFQTARKIYKERGSTVSSVMFDKMKQIEIE